MASCTSASAPIRPAALAFPHSLHFARSVSWTLYRRRASRSMAFTRFSSTAQPRSDSEREVFVSLAEWRRSLLTFSSASLAGSGARLLPQVQHLRFLRGLISLHFGHVFILNQNCELRGFRLRPYMQSTCRSWHWYFSIPRWDRMPDLLPVRHKC